MFMVIGECGHNILLEFYAVVYFCNLHTSENSEIVSVIYSLIYCVPFCLAYQSKILILNPVSFKN